MDRTEILNQRILERNNLANNLNIRFSPRSFPTKYSLPENINTINNFKPFNIIGNNTDFENKINDESILKNRINPLQKCEQSQYIPNIDGQLYNYNIENKEDYQPIQKKKNQSLSHKVLSIMNKVEINAQILES